MTYQKIFVALDKSLQAEVVFEKAVELAQKEGSTLMLFHTIQQERDRELVPFVGTLGDVDMYGTLQRAHRENLRKEIDKVQDFLENYCRRASAKNIATEYAYEFGETGQIICDLAKTWSADLIVLGRRGHKGLSEILLGSVSNYVVHHAPCSVLVVQ